MFSDHFSIDNIPFGIASSPSHPLKSVATRLDGTVIFLDVLGQHGLLPSVGLAVLESFSLDTLNSFASLPKAVHRDIRATLQSLLAGGVNSLPAESVASIEVVTLHLPVSTGDFTDFSCSKEHVLNAGEAILKKRFLPPGFLHFPIGYAGRCSSIVPSGTGIVRPKGQFKNSAGDIVYAATEQLDYELEVALIVGKPSEAGRGVLTKDADEHVFGLVLMNDWSARDIQGLEMTPLGPLNGKSFATSISLWVVTLDALRPFEIAAVSRDIPVAKYLEDNRAKNLYNIQLKAELIFNNNSTTICKSNLGTMYWGFRDMIAHQTSNGCGIKTGDLLATGTISGVSDDSHGCLVELTKGGRESFKLKDGSSRIYLNDGDTVRLSAKAGLGVGFGECLGTIQSTLDS